MHIVTERKMANYALTRVDRCNFVVRIKFAAFDAMNWLLVNVKFGYRRMPSFLGSNDA